MCCPQASFLSWAAPSCHGCAGFVSIVQIVSFYHPPPFYNRHLFTWGRGSSIKVINSCHYWQHTHSVVHFLSMYLCGSSEHSPLVYPTMDKMTEDDNLSLVPLLNNGKVLCEIHYFSTREIMCPQKLFMELPRQVN
jgi:cbb3-type cytochrome oxidase subunit 1